MSKGLDLEAILRALDGDQELEKTAEEQDPKAEETKTEPAPAETQDEGNDLAKIAAEMDDAGRVMARAFADELQKLAVGVVGMTPNTDAIPENPAVQVSNDDVRRDDADKVTAILTQLTMGERAQGPDGYKQVDSNPVDAAQSVAVDEHPTTHDVQNVAKRQAAEAREKTASDAVISALYQKYFGGQE